MKLKEKEIEIRGTKFKLRELSADFALGLGNVSDAEKVGRATLEASIIEPKITPELLKTMPAQVFRKLTEEIGELNGFTAEDFPRVPDISPKAQSGK